MDGIRANTPSVRAGAGFYREFTSNLSQNRARGGSSNEVHCAGGRAGAECVAVSVVASVPATSRAASCEVARQRHGAAVVAVWAQARAFGRTSTTCGSAGRGGWWSRSTSWRGVACAGLWLNSDGPWLCCCAMHVGDGGGLHRSSRGTHPAYGCPAATAVADGSALPLRATAVDVAAPAFGVVTFPNWRAGG